MTGDNIEIALCEGETERVCCRSYRRQQQNSGETLLTQPLCIAEMAAAGLHGGASGSSSTSQGIGEQACLRLPQDSGIILH